MIRRPPRSTHCISSAASDVYKRQPQTELNDYMSWWSENCFIQKRFFTHFFQTLRKFQSKFMHIHLNHKIPNSSLTCGDLSHVCQYSRTNSWDDVRWMLHSVRLSIAVLHWSKRIVLLIFLPITDNITNWTWILTFSIIRILWNQCCISNCELYTFELK